MTISEMNGYAVAVSFTRERIEKPMFVTFGDGKDLVKAGSVGERHCFECGQKRPFSLMVGYEYGHVFYMFGWVRRIDYFFGCDRCKNLRPITKAHSVPFMKNVPIPFMRRYGCVTALIVIVACFAFIEWGL
jgi:hypothetical protein